MELQKITPRLKKFYTLILITLCFVLLRYPKVEAMSDAKRVLFISSYTENFESVPKQINGILEILSPQRINLDIEYMDAKRIPTEENLKFFHSLLKFKLSNVEPYDVLIVGDDSALQFAIDHQEELFPKMPIVYFGINDIARANVAGADPYITGVIEETSLKDNIELALKFNPKATRIVAVVDSTDTGIGDQEQFYANEELFPDLKFETIMASNYSFDEIADKIEAIGNDTILLYLSMYFDKEGTYITISEAAEFFKQHAKVPVYRATVGGVGKGLIGGKMVSFEESGRMAADMVVQVLNGTPIQDIEVITESPNYYVLDYELLKKYDINMDLVPPDTTFINRKIGFYEQHKELVWIITLIISLLSIFLLILSFDNVKRRSIEKALKENHEKLTQTYEELAATEEELRDQYQLIQEHSEMMKLLNRKYELSISSTDSAVWEFDVSTSEINFSENIHHIIDQDVKEYENIENFLDKVLEINAKIRLTELFSKYINHEISEINIQLPFQTLDKSTRWVMIRGQGSENNEGEFMQLHGILLDITKMKEQEIYIEHLAHHDYLTDLPNRICFMDKLRDELEIGKPLAIVMLDIDNFKWINDTLGHVYGDMLLKDIATRLTTIPTNQIFISRFGGDEFLLLISDDTDQKNIKRYLRKIQETFKKPFHIGSREHYIEFSMGISCFPLDSDNLHQLLMNADTAMYQVKHTGKNSYQFYNDAMQESIRERAGIEAILRKALKEDSFFLVYQPQVNVISGEIEGFEALLRLKNHKIPPNVFIKIAEESDLILEIGRLVTREAIAQIARWSDKGFPSKILSINFSSKQLRDLGYVQFLQTTLEEYSVNSSQLEIEITESILLDETNYTVEFLYSLRELGVKIALDDFGTGYSSINYLTYIPVDHVKLDKSLCDKFLQIDNIKVMNSIISLAHSLDLTITAEGIEERKQFERLKEGGCDFIQGYYFSKPLEIEKADEIYNKNFLNPSKT